MEPRLGNPLQTGDPSWLPLPNRASLSNSLTKPHSYPTSSRSPRLLATLIVVGAVQIVVLLALSGYPLQALLRAPVSWPFPQPAVGPPLHSLFKTGLAPDQKAARRRAQGLYQSWTKAYGLATDNPFPPEEVHPPLSSSQAVTALWAPHLEECTAQESFRRSLDKSDSSGFPAWACAKAQQDGSSSFCPSPQPPWVRGSDRDNLDLTAVVQRDLYVHQFPKDCSDPSVRLLVVPWWVTRYHGVGSMVHIMSVALGLAIRSNRVLVPVNFQRANHQGCKSHRKDDTFECYFFPITSRQCEKRGLEAYREAGSPVPDGLHLLSQAEIDQLHGDAEAIVLLGTCTCPPGGNVCLPSNWEVENREASYETEGSVPESPLFAETSWWRAQSTRFILRWPSAYTCHLANRARHLSFGMQVAEDIALAEASQKSIESLSTWKDEGVVALHGTPMERLPEWRFNREPYMPRPIISMHVRQGDKVSEMKLFGLDSYMWHAYRLKRLVPNVRSIWLLTEMQSVIDSLGNYSSWDFYFTSEPRQLQAMHSVAYENAIGRETHVGNMIVNLVIASQCDFAVGTLGSNGDRIVNELRVTGGKFISKYIALNTGEG